MISTFSFSTWVTIGRLVGDHLWQSTLFAALVGLLTLAFHSNRAQVRNALWLAASVKFLIPFAALVAIGGHFGWRKAAPLVQTPAPSAIDMSTISQPFSRLAAGTPPTVVSHSIASIIPILLLAIWLCGCAVILFTWWRFWRRVAVAVRQASPVKHGPELDALRRLETVAGITKPVVLVSSDTSLEPGVFGIATPVLLWPRSLGERLTEAHIEMILAHELSHVRRRDNLAAATHMVVETLFWFHPLVWWLRARMVAERERACDEDVLRLGGDRQVYAESILKVCEFYLESPLACVAGVTGANLKQRMERIMSNRVGATLTGSRKLFLATAGVAALVVPLVAGALTAPRLPAQAQASAVDRLAFDAASIKPNKSGDRMMMFNLTQSGGHVKATNYTLRALIALAYDLPMGTRQTQKTLLGTPAWIDSEHFDIEAEAEGNPSRAQKELMVQSLLADRFKLKMHHEIRQFPVFELVLAKAAKTGPQLQPHTDDAKCFDPSSPAPATTASGDPLPMTCGGFRAEVGALARYAGGKVTMQMLAKELGYVQGIDRPVIDRTGLTGAFDVRLDWTPQLGQSDPAEPNPSAPPSVFTALQEQLGLKLQSATGPVDVLVIDHVEQPSDNSAQRLPDQSSATGGDRLTFDASVKPNKSDSPSTNFPTGPENAHGSQLTPLPNKEYPNDLKPTIRMRPDGPERLLWLTGLGPRLSV